MKRISLLATAILSLGIAYGQNITTYHNTEIEVSREYIEGNTYQEICLAADWAKRAWDYYDALGRT